MMKRPLLPQFYHIRRLLDLFQAGKMTETELSDHLKYLDFVNTTWSFSR